MTPLDALLELLERTGASRGAAALVSEEELSRWPKEAVRELKAQKLLVKAGPASSVVCPGCEQQCTMSVYTLPAGGSAVSFVSCDKRNDISRVPIAAQRMRQWCCGAEAVGAFVARCLGLRAGSQRKTDSRQWELGFAAGKKRSQMLCLRTCGVLELVAGESAVPLTEVVRFEAGGYSLDRDAIRQLVDAATAGDARYTPSVARREARKLATQTLHESWRREYRALKQRKPGMSDVWYSEQIAKMDTTPKRSAETIRKHMKG